MVLVATASAFTLMHIAPGDPYSNLDGNARMPPAVRDMLRTQRGLHQPLVQQYVRWVSNCARGEFGWSSTYQRPVADVLRDALPNTLELMGLAFIASIAFGVLLGAWQGANADSTADRRVSFAALIVYSVPEFWLAMMLLLACVPWLPAGGMASDSASYFGAAWRVWDHVKHLLLPWLTLTLVGTMVMARFQRSAMRDAFGELFVRTARAKGLTERAVRRQALRAALLPVITIGGLYLQSLLAGSVLVERVFSWPGMGFTLLKGINERDYDLVAACAIVGSVMAVLGNVAADIARDAADPRLRRA